MVGDASRATQFLQLHQNMQPVHLQQALRQAHALSDGPEVEQVDFLVHTYPRNCTVTYCSSFVFRFLPPDGQVAVKDPDAPPAIAQPSRLQSGIEDKDL